MKLPRVIRHIIRWLSQPSLANDTCFAPEDISDEEIKEIVQIICQKKTQ
jgi:hypothetical protein